MKRLIACTVLIGAMAAPSLLAIPSSGQVEVGRINGTYTSGGGEYRLTSYNTTPAFDFQSFCLEKEEGIVGMPAWYVLNPKDAAVLGGVNTSTPPKGGGDPISYGTAFLYSEFRKGTLFGYDYTIGSGREASADALQKAIWYLEDEISLAAAGAANPFLGLLDLSVAKLDANGAFGVKVMNLYLTDSSGTVIQLQDFLAVPDGGLTVALLGMGLAGLGWVNRRIRR